MENTPAVPTFQSRYIVHYAVPMLENLFNWIGEGIP